MIYQQPDEYHFSQDSIELASYALSFNQQSDGKTIYVIDVGAGCGVVGLQWARYYQSSYDLVLLEKQSIFHESLKENTMRSCCPSVIIEMKGLDSYPKDSFYHMALSNPPYFIDGSNRQSHCPIKQQCRHIAEVDLKLWFKKIHDILLPGGRFFFSFRHDNWLTNVDKNWLCLDRKMYQGYTMHHWEKVRS